MTGTTSMPEPGPELVALGRGSRAERGLHAGASAAAVMWVPPPHPSGPAGLPIMTGPFQLSLLSS